MAEKKYIATEQTQVEIKELVALIKDSVVGGISSGTMPHITVIAPTGCTVTATNGSTVLTSEEIGVSGVYQFNVPNLGDWVITTAKEGRSGTRNVAVTEVKEYKIKTSYGYRFGYRIKDSESSPSARVEYLFDAAGLEPAYMDFTRGIFNFGGWADKWFVTENKPCMLMRDGTVDYYLDPSNYDVKEDGGASDVSNASYDGNAMAEFPLIWVKRYTDGDYRYVIFSDVRYDNDYEADAFVRADGTVGEHFYYSMFGASGSASMLRSLSGQTRVGSLTMAQELTGANANGSLWSTHTWSRFNLIRDLCVLMGKSTDLQSVFGNGNCRSASSASGILQTGTLKDKGQFFGYNSSTNQVKVFHSEAFWGDMWDRLAGILINNYEPYVQMSRKNGEYSASSISGMTGVGITIPSGMSASYITSETVNKYGSFPMAVGGSTSTYYAAPGWSASGLMCLFVGASANNAVGYGGGFTWNSNNAPTNSNWNNGCGLSYLKKKCFASSMLCIILSYRWKLSDKGPEE